MALSDNCEVFIRLNSGTLTDEIGGATITTSNASYDAGDSAWVIDNSSGRISIAGVTLTPPFTIAVQTYVAGSGNNKTYASYNIGSSQYWQLFQNNTFDAYARARAGGTIVDATGGTLTGSVFNNTAGVFTSSTSRQCYLDSTLGTAETTSCAPSGSDEFLTIGAVWDGGSVTSVAESFKFKNFAVWSRALSDAELDSYFANPTDVLGTDTTPPTLTSGTATGGTLTGTGGVTSNEAGTLYWQVNGSATALTYPSSGTMTGWTSRSMTATAQTWSLSTLTAGTKYLHLVGEDAAGNRTASDLVVGPFTVASAGTAPTITVQPTNQTVTTPTAATFSVTATGTSLTYQWKRNGTDISGAISSSYTTPATTVTGGSANNGDVYSVVVTGDTSPAATSNNATLAVNPVTPKTITLTLTTDGTNPASSLSGLKWAFFDQVSPGSFLAPSVKGSSGSTNSLGVLSLAVDASSLSIGQTGWLVVTNSNGTTSQNPPGKTFSAPVIIS